MNLLNNDSGTSFSRGLLLLYALIAGLLALTWRRLPDAVVDFGRELYVPWRITQGDTLYIDIAYFNGPLSPYFNALLFECFGTSMTTLMVANATLLVLLTTIIYRLLVEVCRVGTAMLTGSMFLIVFAFSHALRIGNYNYICPYSHEMTHGITLIFIMLFLVFSRFAAQRFGQLGIGLIWGLVFLGKAELFLAASGMLFTSVLIVSLGRQRPLREASIQLSIAIIGAMIPAAFFVWLLSLKMDLVHALHGVAGTWYWIAHSDVAGGEFYRRLSGFDHPWNNLATMIQSTIAVGLAIAFAKSFDAWRIEQRKPWLAVAAISLAGIAYLNQGIFPFVLHDYIWPVMAIAIFTIALWQRLKTSGNDCRQKEFAIVWAVMAGLLLAKFPLRSTILHYGFVLAMPVVLLSFAWSMDRLPKLLCRRTGGATCHVVLCFLLIADVLGYGTMTASNIVARQQRLGYGHDCIWVDAERGGKQISDAVDYLQANTDATDSVLVLPEGVMINYQTRRRSSIPYVNLCPPEVTMYGETNILGQLNHSPADIVVLVNRDVREYGVSIFGAEDYGKGLMDWVVRNYQIEVVFGASFSDSTEHGVTVMRRRVELLSRQALRGDHP